MYVLLTAGARWEELLAFCAAQAAQHPDDLDSERNRMTALTGLGRQSERERVNQALVDGGKASANDFNNLAWSFLVRGEAPDRALDYARRSLLMVPGNSAAQHTLASILAERGETTASLEMLRKVLASEDSPSPREEEWYVFGRIAEQFGEKEAAKACYLRLKEPKEALARPESCYVLAQRRLALM